MVLDPSNLQALKVTDLKAELKKRGLPASGLKQVLVDRLRDDILKNQDQDEDQEQDPQSGEASGAAAEDEQAEPEPEPAPEPIVEDALPARVDVPKEPETAPAAEEAPEVEGVETKELEDVEKVQVQPGTVVMVEEKPEEPKAVEESKLEVTAPVEEKPAEELQSPAEDVKPEPTQPGEEEESPPVRAENEQSHPEQRMEPAAEPMDVDAPTQGEPEPQLEEPAESAPLRQEQQPSPDSPAEETPVTAPEAMETDTVPKPENGDTVMTEKTVVYADRPNETNPQPVAVTVNTEVVEDAAGLLKRKRRSASPPPPAEPSTADSPPSTKKQRQESPPRRAPTKDARFKGLFNDTAMPDARPANDLDAPEALEDDETPVEPSIHPGTRALYIRNFLRPLNEAALRSHITQLASRSAGADEDENPVEDNIIETFFLDSIKSHALIVFANLTAATRVRVGIHGKIFPAEKTRKPLWADFVPEEKVDGWVVHERERGGRWEVAYEHIGGEVVVELVETGSTMGGSSGGGGALAGRVGPPMQQRRSVDISNAPTGPRRGSEVVQRRPGMVVRDLDDLFMSTNTKPKLYYLPVDQDLARQRLRDRMDNRVVRGRR